MRIQFDSNDDVLNYIRSTSSGSVSVHQQLSHVSVFKTDLDENDEDHTDEGTR
jgi:hypothetical protein